MSPLSVASAGCRQLAAAVDGLGSLVALVLRLNNALAARLVAALAVLADGLLLVLARLRDAAGILLADLAAFVADIGDAVTVLAELTAAAVTELALAVGRVFTALGDGVGAVLGAVLGLVRAVLGAVSAVWAAVSGLVVTGVRSVVLLYHTTIYLLTMVPYGLVAGVVRCFTLLESMLVGLLCRCLAVCAGAADAIWRAVLGVVDGARAVPLAAVLGAALLVLALLAVRRLARLVSARGPPLVQLRHTAGRLVTAGRRVSAAASVRAWRGTRPLAERLVRAADRGTRGASDGLRAAAAVCRLSVAVLLAAAEIVTRGVHAFFQNVTLGLRLGVAGGQQAVAPAAELEPREQAELERQERDWELERQDWEQQEQDWEQERQDWELERATPPPVVAPRRRLRQKAGCSSPSRRPAADPSRACVVCLDQDKSVILLPCRHVCLCEPCGRQVGAGDRRCPMCREFIQDALKVYI
ncbi:E3 ubiquitin-protein ligase RNF26-like [Amphibalanus amphitrite]|uniref:E3 ubiquitin-protein ligase RNF26-like n=1 Tax=Amphibalanus amphitrite TaxID=1232801 RepID=UPI001C8FFFBF|nr:E3 ubiquitin-protein ligase RNF26-like [Amphibalanus amphitrite]